MSLCPYVLKSYVVYGDPFDTLPNIYVIITPFTALIAIIFIIVGRIHRPLQLYLRSQIPFKVATHGLLYGRAWLKRK